MSTKWEEIKDTLVGGVLDSLAASFNTIVRLDVPEAKQRLETIARDVVEYAHAEASGDERATQMLDWLRFQTKAVIAKYALRGHRRGQQLAIRVVETIAVMLASVARKLLLGA